MNTTIEQLTVTLYYREGSSDKVYQAVIEPKGEGFVVNFAYGRRGSTLQTGTKSSSPVKYEQAVALYNKLVNEKKAKGYTEGENSTPYQHTRKEDRVAGLLPQLLNPIGESQLDNLIDDDNWCAQEKFDGKRVLIQKEGAAIHGINRRGLLIGIPSTLVAAVKVFNGDFVIDGECVGDRFCAFDILAHDGEDLRPEPYDHRAAHLLNLLCSGQQRQIIYADTAWDRQQKADLLKQLRQQNKEGIVFKQLDAPYTAGRPNSGGAQLKHKFYATLSAIVMQINQKRSIELHLLSSAGSIPVGNVTIPANHNIPRVGQVVEVRYLYAFKESNCLYQPVFLGVRTDIAANDCKTNQLKFKSSTDDEQ